MSLTPEQKKTVAEFMGWVSICNGHSKIECSVFNSYCTECVRYKTFSLNDASLCVEEMEKRRLYFKFIKHVKQSCPQSKNIKNWQDAMVDIEIRSLDLFTALMTMESGEAENFFTAMAAWIEEKK